MAMTWFVGDNWPISDIHRKYALRETCFLSSRNALAVVNVPVILHCPPYIVQSPVKDKTLKFLNILTCQRSGFLQNFLTSLNTKAKNLTIIEKQQIVRSLVKEVQIEDEKIHIVHSIPLKKRPISTEYSEIGESYRLCLGSGCTPFGWARGQRLA